jgi:hypothetical protein
MVESPAPWPIGGAAVQATGSCRRRGLTLAELLVASCVTALVVTALAVFAKAVMDGCGDASNSGIATQASRVVTARITNSVAKSHQVLRLPDALLAMPEMKKVLVVWERDGGPSDTAPGQPNFVELVIFAPYSSNSAQLLELRPQVDPAMVAPVDQPAVFYTWINRFRDGQQVQQPSVALLDDLGGIQFDIDEYAEPEGIGGLVQQNVRIALCVNLTDSEPTAFFASATRRYVAASP